MAARAHCFAEMCSLISAMSASSSAFPRDIDADADADADTSKPQRVAALLRNLSGAGPRSRCALERGSTLSQYQHRSLTFCMCQTIPSPLSDQKRPAAPAAAAAAAAAAPAAAAASAAARSNFTLSVSCSSRS